MKAGFVSSHRPIVYSNLIVWTVVGSSFDAGAMVKKMGSYLYPAMEVQVSVMALSRLTSLRSELPSGALPPIDTLFLYQTMMECQL
jgi:hypothetical protein